LSDPLFQTSVTIQAINVSSIGHISRVTVLERDDLYFIDIAKIKGV